MKWTFRFFLTLHKFMFRISKGRFGGKARGLDVLILNTIGRRTGKTRAVPLGYFIEDDCYFVAAFAGDAPRNPGWYYNLNARADVVIEISGGRRIEVRAQEIDGDERTRLWNKFTQIVEDDEANEHKLDRVIPIMRLEPTYKK